MNKVRQEELEFGPPRRRLDQSGLGDDSRRGSEPCGGPKR